MSREFQVYDIVSRMGEDEQIVTTIDDDLCMTVMCIKAGGCFDVGEVEYNLQRRYEFLRHGTPKDLPWDYLDRFVVCRDSRTNEIIDIGTDMVWLSKRQKRQLLQQIIEEDKRRQSIPYMDRKVRELEL